MSSGFPSDVLRLLCLSAAFYFSGAVTSNNPLLPMQLRSARKRKSSRRTSERKLVKYDPILLKLLFCATYWTCIINFHFLKLQVAVKDTYCCFKALVLTMENLKRFKITFSFPMFFFSVKTWCLHYPQCNWLKVRLLCWAANLASNSFFEIEMRSKSNRSDKFTSFWLTIPSVCIFSICMKLVYQKTSCNM